MTFKEFSEALSCQMNAFLIINKSLERMIRPELKQQFIPDPFTRCVGERFGTPAVKWHKRDEKTVISLPEGEFELIQRDKDTVNINGMEDSCSIHLVNNRYTVTQNQIER